MLSMQCAVSRDLSTCVRASCFQEIWKCLAVHMQHTIRNIHVCACFQGSSTIGSTIFYANSNSELFLLSAQHQKSIKKIISSRISIQVDGCSLADLIQELPSLNARSMLVLGQVRKGSWLSVVLSHWRRSESSDLIVILYNYLLFNF